MKAFGAVAVTPHRKMFKFYRHVIKDEEGFHWGRAADSKRHTSACDGDHLVTPFQCDLCVLRNLQGRNPGVHDTLLLECIRQVSLDALWGRETATVDSTRRAVTQTVKILKQVRLEPPYPPLGPFPVMDNMGYAIAIAMILKSREPGRYAEYQHFESIRKLRTGFTNVYMTSVTGTESLRTIGGDKAKYSLNNCPTHSSWFEKFSKGCLSRMGQVVKQDRAVSLDLMHAFLQLLDEEWEKAQCLKEQSLVASLGASVGRKFS